MSSTRHAVHLSPSFTGAGNRPDLTPLQKVERETGMMAGIGGFAFLSPIMVRIFKNPVCGNVFIGIDSV